MKKVLGISLFILVLMFGISSAQTVQELIAKADSLTTKAFDDDAALKVLLQAEKMEPNNWEIEWRLSRAYSNIAAHMPKDKKDEQYKVYQTALKHANKAVKLAPNQSHAYVRRAIVNGRIALFKGVFSVAGVVTKVRDDCLKSLKLNNGNVYTKALTHYILARTHAKLSQKWHPALTVLGLGWASLDTALVHYQKALDLAPQHIIFYVDYAKALYRDDQYRKAKKLLEKALTLKITERDDPERLKEARALLKEVNDEL
jgi:tetratricopeptide (TPR) repeat protein